MERDAVLPWGQEGARDVGQGQPLGPVYLQHQVCPESPVNLRLFGSQLSPKAESSGTEPAGCVVALGIGVPGTRQDFCCDTNGRLDSWNPISFVELSEVSHFQGHQHLPVLSSEDSDGLPCAK